MAGGVRRVAEDRSERGDGDVEQLQGVLKVMSNPSTDLDHQDFLHWWVDENSVPF